MLESLRVLIIGGVACGPKTGSRLKRILPDAEVTMIEREHLPKDRGILTFFAGKGGSTMLGKLLETISDVALANQLGVRGRISRTVLESFALARPGGITCRPRGRTSAHVH
jgi:hypothetical protein